MTHDEIKAAGYRLSRYNVGFSERPSRMDVVYFAYRVENGRDVPIGEVRPVGEERTSLRRLAHRPDAERRTVRVGWSAHLPLAGRTYDTRKRPSATGFKTVNEAASYLIQADLKARGLSLNAERSPFDSPDWKPLNERERWVRRTREAVARTLARDAMPVSAEYLVDNLDGLGGYATGLGFYDRRSALEIGAALRWLVSVGIAREIKRERIMDDEMPGGKLYEMTMEGFDSKFLRLASESPTPRYER